MRTTLRLRLWLAAACAALPLAAAAQVSAPQLATSPALRCLSPAPAERGEPEYPFAPWKRGEAGRVVVALSFAGPAEPPSVTVLAREGDRELAKSVEAHVAKFRVPCMAAGEPTVQLQQEYIFTPDKRRVRWTAPVDLADATRSRQLACLQRTDKAKGPDYPAAERRAGITGNLLARLRFTAPDQPPQVTVHHAMRDQQALAREVEDFSRNFRLPCLEGAPLEMLQSYVFRLQGDAPTGFRNIDFLQFLRAVKDIERQNFSIDTTTMGCPFDVSVNYHQPYERNVVGQVGEVEATRQPLLEWLATLELKLEPRALAAVLGDTAKFTVPCIKIDLKPKETS